MGVELRGRPEGHPGPGPVRARRLAVFDGLHRPAGADADHDHAARHVECRRSHHPRLRVGSDDPRERRRPGRRPCGLARRDLRQLPGDWPHGSAHQRGRASTAKLARVVGTRVGRLDADHPPRRLGVAPCGHHLEEHGVLHALQRRRPAAGADGPPRPRGRDGPGSSPLVDPGVWSKPDRSAGHHRVEQRTAARHRRAPASRARWASN